MKFDHVNSMIVYFDEVDMAGGLYHANYLKYLDRSRIEYLRNSGMSFTEFLRSGTALVVGGLNCTYISPLFCEEEILICSRVIQVKTSSLVVDQKIYRKSGLDLTRDDVFETSKPVFEAEVVLVHINLAKKAPIPIEGRLKEVLGGSLMFRRDDKTSG